MPRTSDADREFPYYPAFLDVRKRRVVVVGGGEIATVKVQGLLPCGPEPLIVIATEVGEEIRRASDAGQLDWRRRPYEDGDLTDADLVFAATDNRELNASVAREARRRRIPVLAVDDIPNCDFIAPAVVKRGDLTIAFSTNGRSPAFARWLRERFDREVPGSWATLLEVAGSVRKRLGPKRATVPPESWQHALDELDLFLRAMSVLEAEEWLLARLLGEVNPLTLNLTPQEREPSEEAQRPTLLPVGAANQIPVTLGSGFVSLVGAGPGDPELLTLRALRRLQEADVIVHDRLIGAEIMERCRPDARLIDVGKSAGSHSCPQSDINEVLIQLARSGRRVVRLKGGDPFVFGRGGEEALALAEADIPFEVVPGVSAALAVPEVVGIPVTHRGRSTSVTIATGHGQIGSNEPGHDWAALAAMRGTLVFLMAVENLDQIVDQLLANGRNPDEPAALIESGTMPEQRVIRATLADIVSSAREAIAKPPAILVIGPTVALADRLGVIFRRSDQASDRAAADRPTKADLGAERELLEWLHADHGEVLV